MNELASILSETDLSFIVQVLMPGYREKARMMKTLAEDEEMLEGVLKDENLFKFLMENPDSIVKVSPQLFFTVVLLKVMNDLEGQSYTVEQEERIKVFIFDSNNVVKFLKEEKILFYLIDLLCSFVKINSCTVMLRIKRGVWRRFKFSDFNIDSLLKYSEMIDEESRFLSYKRIADICLFMTGVFPAYLSTGQAHRVFSRSDILSSSRKSKDELRSYGRHFYRAAAQHKDAYIHQLHQVLSSLSEKFDLAEKPLTFMSQHYLGLLKENLFRQ
ncbi:MAG: hypothetical protein JSV25_00060 [Spirochaetota bacterium]|nr:MAG: hypothetical protein JSV25_00060 [Spirochaetota bacterium]